MLQLIYKYKYFFFGWFDDTKWKPNATKTQKSKRRQTKWFFNYCICSNYARGVYIFAVFSHRVSSVEFYCNLCALLFCVYAQEKQNCYFRSLFSVVVVAQRLFISIENNKLLEKKREKMRRVKKPDNHKTKNQIEI